MDVRDDLTMNDFLREYLGMTGTKFGCGAAQCLSCAVIVDNRRRDELHQPDLRRLGGELQRQGDPHRRRPCEGRRTLRPAKGLHRALRFPVRLLHRGLPERGAGSAGASGEEAGGARRSREDHRRGARRPPCRCTGYIKYHEAVRDVILADPKRYLVASQVTRRARAKRNEIGDAVSVSRRDRRARDEHAARVTRPPRPRRTRLPPRKALPRSRMPKRGRRRCSPNSAKC